ncbi:MAG: hypothetical protein JO046_23475 [Solirubrobacterales bacterium]|nr:hypothetical protein [Solirubrobacterales bacterium]
MREGPSHRDFLKGLGATGTGLLAGSPTVGVGRGTSSAEAASGLRRSTRANTAGPQRAGEQRRLREDLPDLPPFAEATDTVRGAVLEVGSAGGIMDPGDQLAAGAQA